MIGETVTLNLHEALQAFGRNEDVSDAKDTLSKFAAIIGTMDNEYHRHMILDFILDTSVENMQEELSILTNILSARIIKVAECNNNDSKLLLKEVIENLMGVYQKRIELD